MRPNTEADFWARVVKEDGCWRWVGAIDRGGYGRFTVRRRAIRAHRYAWEAVNGPVPTGLCVCHHCDNPRCVRPDHLFVGTYADNNRDRDAKGRTARGLRSGAHTMPWRRTFGDRNGLRKDPSRAARGDASGARLHPETRARGQANGAYTKPERLPRGSTHGRAKITEDDVREIRRLRANGVSVKALVARFGIGKSMVSYIVQRKFWRHVP